MERKENISISKSDLHTNAYFNFRLTADIHTTLKGLRCEERIRVCLHVTPLLCYGICNIVKITYSVLSDDNIDILRYLKNGNIGILS